MHFIKAPPLETHSHLPVCLSNNTFILSSELCEKTMCTFSTGLLLSLGYNSILLCSRETEVKERLQCFIRILSRRLWTKLVISVLFKFHWTTQLVRHFPRKVRKAIPREFPLASSKMLGTSIISSCLSSLTLQQLFDLSRLKFFFLFKCQALILTNEDTRLTKKTGGVMCCQ